MLISIQSYSFTNIKCSFRNPRWLLLFASLESHYTQYPSLYSTWATSVSHGASHDADQLKTQVEIRPQHMNRRIEHQ